MIVMPANCSGWEVHCLARETGKLGHLYSPKGQRGPFPWLPYALDNGAFSCWNPEDNSFDEEKWKITEILWKHLLFWAMASQMKPIWAIVPDRPGNWDETCLRWSRYAGIVSQNAIPLAVAVQDGATVESVLSLKPSPKVIAIGGTTEWKWSTLEMWVAAFPRVHVLRCNMPDRLDYLQMLCVESCDGTGWTKERRKFIALEKWCRGLMNRSIWPIAPHLLRKKRDKHQDTFA